MNPEKITLYAVQQNSDWTEGRGIMLDVYYTKTRELALKIVSSPVFYKKYGVQGTAPYDGGKSYVAKKELVIIDSLEEFLQIEKHAEAIAALSKLTEREKELLGLK